MAVILAMCRGAFEDDRSVFVSAEIVNHMKVQNLIVSEIYLYILKIFLVIGSTRELLSNPYVRIWLWRQLFGK